MCVDVGKLARVASVQKVLAAPPRRTAWRGGVFPGGTVTEKIVSHMMLLGWTGPRLAL